MAAGRRQRDLAARRYLRRAGDRQQAATDAMTASHTAGEGAEPTARDDAACWQEARRLRSGNPGWVVIWLAPAGEYRASRRLPGTRRDTTLAAATPAALAAAITDAEQAARGQDSPR